MSFKQQQHDDDRLCVNIQITDATTQRYEAVIHVGQYGRTKLRTHDWDGVLVVDDENTKIFPHVSPAPETYMKRKAISKRSTKHRNQTFLKIVTEKTINPYGVMHGD